LLLGLALALTVIADGGTGRPLGCPSGSPRQISLPPIDDLGRAAHPDRRAVTSPGDRPGAHNGSTRWLVVQLSTKMANVCLESAAKKRRRRLRLRGRERTPGGTGRSRTILFFSRVWCRCTVAPFQGRPCRAGRSAALLYVSFRPRPGTDWDPGVADVAKRNSGAP